MSPLTRLTGICCALLLLVPLSAQDAKLQIYRVDDHVYRGKQPTRQDIAGLAGSGVRTVLDLRGTVDHEKWEQQAVEAAGMKYVRIGLSGIFAPTDRQIDKILAVLEDPALGPVFVHCRRGADRSGVVIACYRIVARPLDECAGNGGGAPTGIQPAGSPDAALHSALPHRTEGVEVGPDDPSLTASALWIRDGQGGVFVKRN